MKSIEFCYWLQGLFELQEIEELNKKQTTQVKKHLEMVFAHEKEPNNFCVFLNGYFKIQQPKTIETEQLGVIKQYLNNIFEHVVAQKIEKPAKDNKDNKDKNKVQEGISRRNGARDIRMMC